MSLHRTVPSPDAPPGGVAHHRDHILESGRDDPYRAQGKYREPTVCLDCGLVYRHGRWMRAEPPVPASARRCPACSRLADKMPAGYLVLSGPFVDAHRAEIMNLIGNEAEREAAEHPLQRVMEITESPEGVAVTTTDVHLARRLGQALEHAWRGTLDVRQSQDEYLVRVHWSR